MKISKAKEKKMMNNIDNFKYSLYKKNEFDIIFFFQLAFKYTIFIYAATLLSMKIAEAI